MAVPSYDDLLARTNVDSTLMELTIKDEHLRKLASNIESCELLGMYLEIPDADIERIMSQGGVEVQRIKLLKCWKQRCGSAATYRAMVTALLQINRTDLAEKVIGLRLPFRDTSQSPPSSPCEVNLATPTSPASSSGMEDMPFPAASYPSSLLTSPVVQTQRDMTPTLKELEEEFYQAVTNIESILKINEVEINILTSRFRMLPQHIRKRYEADENYIATRKKILDSKTTKELFDNLTILKHWSYMMPETLEYILKDVNIDAIHQIIDKYTRKLKFFKENTKLRELIGAEFPVPDYCMELTMEVEGWEDKTIQEVENKAKILLQRAVYDGQAVGLGWKRVNTGSVTLTFIVMKDIKPTVDNEKLSQVCKVEGVVSIQIDGEILSSNQTEEVWKLAQECKDEGVVSIQDDGKKLPSNDQTEVWI